MKRLAVKFESRKNIILKIKTSKNAKIKIQNSIRCPVAQVLCRDIYVLYSQLKQN